MRCKAFGIRAAAAIVGGLTTFISGGIAAPMVEPKGGTNSQNLELYSGIECLERAAKGMGKPLDPVRLITSTHVNPGERDVTKTLVELAREQGLTATIMPSPVTAKFAKSKAPLILHVRGSPYSAVPDFFVLSTTVSDGSVVLTSSIRSGLTVPLERLAHQRRGPVIVLSTASGAAADAGFYDSSFLADNGGVLTIIIVAAGVVAVAMMLFKRRRRLEYPRGRITRLVGSIWPAGRLLIIATTAALFSQMLRGGPILPNVLPHVSDSGIEAIDFLSPPPDAQTHARPTLVEIGLPEALQAQGAGSLFIDARDAGEFDSRHIRGAILCPAADVSHWRLHLAGIPFDRPLVVYCGEASCGKGEYVAKFLLSSGFTDVRLYRDGWAKWTGPKQGQ